MARETVSETGVVEVGHGTGARQARPFPAHPSRDKLIRLCSAIQMCEMFPEKKHNNMSSILFRIFLKLVHFLNPKSFSKNKINKMRLFFYQ